MTMWCGVAAFPSRPVVPRLCASLKVQTFMDCGGQKDLRIKSDSDPESIRIESNRHCPRVL